MDEIDIWYKKVLYVHFINVVTHEAFTSGFSPCGTQSIYIGYMFNTYWRLVAYISDEAFTSIGQLKRFHYHSPILRLTLSHIMLPLRI